MGKAFIFDNLKESSALTWLFLVGTFHGIEPLFHPFAFAIPLAPFLFNVLLHLFDSTFQSSKSMFYQWLMATSSYLPWVSCIYHNAMMMSSLSKWLMKTSSALCNECLVLTTMPLMSPLSKRLMATSSAFCKAVLILWAISRFRSIERPSNWKRWIMFICIYNYTHMPGNYNSPPKKINICFINYDL